MNRADLAATVKVTRQHLDFILAGKRRPGASLAARLEMATGVPRLSWLYPNEYPNPMLKVKSTNGD